MKIVKTMKIDDKQRKTTKNDEKQQKTMKKQQKQLKTTKNKKKLKNPSYCLNSFKIIPCSIFKYFFPGGVDGPQNVF